MVPTLEGVTPLSLTWWLFVPLCWLAFLSMSFAVVRAAAVRTSPPSTALSLRAGFSTPLLLALTTFVALLPGVLGATHFSVSDSVEYLAAARNFVAHGRFGITLHGEWYPSRFPWWFPATFLAPLLTVFGMDADWAPLLSGVLSFAVSVLAAAYLGERISGCRGALVAAGCVVSIPGVRYFATEALSDIPAAMLALFLCVLYLWISEGKHSLANFVLAGIFIALGCGFRPTFVGYAAPFLFFAWRERSLRALLGISLPLGFVVALTLWSNVAIFGSALRTGYHFWLPVPYEFFGLTFNAGYFLKNLQLFIEAGGGLLLLLAPLMCLLASPAHKVSKVWQGERTAMLASSWVLLCGTVVILAVHLFYFYHSPRFFYPVLFPAAAIVGGVLGGFLRGKEISVKVLTWCLVAGVLLFSLAHLPQHTAPWPAREAVRRVRESASEGGVVITTLNPLIVESQLQSGSPWKVLPFSREEEFASKLILPRPPGGVPLAPASPFDHRGAVARELGAVEAYPQVAEDIEQKIVAQVAAGKEVFLVGVLPDAVREKLLAWGLVVAPLSNDGAWRLLNLKAP